MKFTIAPLLSLALCEALASSIPAMRHGIKPKRNNHARPALAARSGAYKQHCDVVKPKVFIISMFTPEAEVWYGDSDLNLLAKNITIPGFSPIFPDAHCSKTGDVCQMTTGEGEINAAGSVNALWLSGCFDLTTTYFLIAGIAGVNPHQGTTGSVTFAKYAVQFDLQYEFAQSQVPANATSGYYPQGATSPDETNGTDYPTEIYGTEAFELNDALKKRAVGLAKKATLNDSAAAAAYRATYGYAPADKPPAVVECDSGTANTYFSGSVLGDAFGNYSALLTNGSAVYCAAQQEDNATLESLLRGALAGTLDFARVILMRTISDFDRAPPGEDEVFHLLEAEQEGFEISILNIYQAGIEIVDDILKEWKGTYKKGVKATNYVGDLWNSLPGEVKPDIGTADIWIH